MEVLLVALASTRHRLQEPKRWVERFETQPALPAWACIWPVKAKVLITILTWGLVFVLQCWASEDNSRFEKEPLRLPAAVADTEGVLTTAGSKAFPKKMTGNRGHEQAASTRAPDDGQRHIYKEIGEVKLPLYVYQPLGHKPDARTPAIVFFFGGGWKTGSPTQFMPHCRHFAGRGMVAITVEYRVSSRYPGVRVEDCVEDAKSAMRWVRAHASKLGVDPDRIASGGGSAGGHLAACVALMDDFNAASDNLQVSARPNAMVLFNPAMGGWDTSGNGDGTRTHGPLSKVTPLTYASRKQPPCIMFFGSADALLQGAEHFRSESERAGNTCKMVTYEGQGHGFFNHGRSDGKFYNLTLAEADRFLVDLGWLPSK